MTELCAALTAAGFPAGQERLDKLVVSLKAADFERLEDLQGAVRCVVFSLAYRCACLYSFPGRLQDEPCLRDLPSEDRAFLGRVVDTMQTVEVAVQSRTLVSASPLLWQGNRELCGSFDQLSSHRGRMRSKGASTSCAESQPFSHFFRMPKASGQHSRSRCCRDSGFGC